jgi:hypothetical protein
MCGRPAAKHDVGHLGNIVAEAVNEATRREWRELGFFYDRDDDAKAWRIVGTEAGLGTFAKLLRAYASEPKHDVLSEHEHLGPYMYLEIGTWTEPEITDHWIAGPRTALGALAQLIERSIPELRVGGSVSFREAFAPKSAYDLVLELRAEPFDPAKDDSECW